MLRQGISWQGILRQGITGYAMAEYITTGYITAGYITAVYIMAGYITVSWKRKLPYLDPCKTNMSFDYRVRKLSARSTTCIPLAL